MGEPVVGAAVGRPEPALRPFVARYLGYRREGLAPGSHQGLPSRHVTVIISLGSPVDVAGMPDPAQPPGSFRALACGLHTTPATIHHDGYQYGVHLELTPVGAGALLGVPARELASHVVDLSDLLGRRAGELSDRMATAAGWPERFAVLDQVLARGAVEVDPPAPEVAWAWRDWSQHHLVELPSPDGAA